MGWAITFLGVILIIVVIVGAAIILLRRYCIGWRCDARNLWSVCDEWWHKLYWLWAPREEKVGLVKAQHPTAQTVPGLYRQTGNTSQHLLHSDSDLRLDAQGAFTRFEAVDRDLHPPLGTGSTIPPQPLRPAPQPRPTPRPRPSPLHAPNAVDYIKMQDANPGPLTPPPFAPNASPQRATQPAAFIFQSDQLKSSYGSHKVQQQTTSRFDNYAATRSAPETIQMNTPYSLLNKGEGNVFDFEPSKCYVNKSNNNSSVNNNTVLHGKYNTEEHDDHRREFLNKRTDFLRGFEHHDEFTKIRYNVQGAPLSENELSIEQDGNSHSATPPYGSYDIVQRRHSRSESRSDNFSVGNSSIARNVYGPEMVSKVLQTNENLSGSDVETKSGNGQSIELIRLGRDVRDDGTETDEEREDELSCYASNKLQNLQRVSQYLQSLPDPTSDRMMSSCLSEEQMITTPDSVSTPTVHSEAASSPLPPPPPAPPDPPNSSDTLRRKTEPTTGERIFNALRSVTSQNCIDASEFYNSVLSSAQQVQRFTFSPISRSSTVDNGSLKNQLNSNTHDAYFEKDGIGNDNLRKGSDLYSPELNLEAHRTAQEVYNSLQDPPASPLLLKDLSQEPYPSYMADPSFTRTSEDIFNSFERRKSMERLNGHHDFGDINATDMRRRNSHELYATLEEAQIKRRLSQSLEESLFSTYTTSDFMESLLESRRGSLFEPEPPTDDSNLKRAISCESVCSDTSVVLGDMEEAPVVGHVCVGLEHERWWSGRGADSEGDLIVSILEARDLMTPDGQPAQNTFARVCLLPDRQTLVQTRFYKGSPSPSYQEKFLFPLDGGPVGKTLLVEVFSVDTDMGGDASLLGEATLRLGPAPRPSATTWLPLISPVLPVPQLGELLFSLSYLPTAERLHLVVVKARNLRGMTPPSGDFFVKVYLLEHGKKLHKKKTSVKKGEKSPIFNEAIIFNVPQAALQTIQLRLTVAEVTGEQGANSKTFPVGHIIVGSSTSGRALAHWRQMLTALRRPVAVWHPLRK